MRARIVVGRAVCVALFAILAATATTQTARAQHLVPGVGEPGHDAALASKADAYSLQLHTFMTRPLGFGLEAFVDDPADRAAIDDFFASGERDFAARAGRHPYEAISSWGEHGDLGMFGGVQAAGDAFRYAVLRDSGAAASDVGEARAILLRAMDGLHWMTQVTGEPGLVARGLMRITPEAGDPPLPGAIPPTVPLFDAAGNPQPAEKEPTWRADVSGELPFLIWFDDCSKDQLDGYVFALGAVYDVVAMDDTISRASVDRLIADARAIGAQLMERIEVARDTFVDLVIQDADGRPTSFHDLSGEEIAPGAVLPGGGAFNGFNAWMALGIVRTLYHIGGDEALGRFYYEELVGRRDYLRVVEESISVMYFGEQTNYSNVNMAFVAAYGVLRYETDMAVAGRARFILESFLYAVGRTREARGLGQAFFDYLYAGFREGLRPPGETAVTQGTDTLREFPAPPYWDPVVVNCDTAEIAAHSCTAIDGTTSIALATAAGRGGSVVAVLPLPKRLRPPSNFEWRSDPHAVNGGGGNRLNPGGGFHAAYWMGRYLLASETGYENVSPIARAALPWTPAMDGGVRRTDGGAVADGGVLDGGADGGGGDGCGCFVVGARGPASRPRVIGSIGMLSLCISGRGLRRGLLRRRSSERAATKRISPR